ncbi:hydantoinase B/oxoprolinase family protein [Amycolatopsis sp. WGS_07]|uniref:hydantoinase B/oxoprolinase family protein n=1 Tax=Amycolatopsis sp. WGS_07 TaxID=3076764 RepID=UPI0038732228
MTDSTRTLGPALMAVIANRMDAILREMTNTLLRAGRSAVLSTARDFSCSLVTADNRLLATAEGLPVHIFGSHLQTQTMSELHDDIAPGDAFLHNDPYSGNTHNADHTILVPVFAAGKHMFTTVAKAHQADIGNSFPTTYMAMAKDVYEEGALIFPATRIQRNYHDVGDIIRMCRMRIRVPDQWYGDYLACIGAARIGERRMIQLVEKYGADLIEEFVEEWFDYSERRVDHALRGMESGRYEATSAHDALPGLSDEEIPIKVSADVDAENGRVEIDLRDNPDCLDAGINLSRATSVNSAATGLFNVLEPDLPHNHGTFRRITVHIRENCVAGYPVHPRCCSMSTTNVADRVVNATQSALSGVARVGLAEGGASMGAGTAVVAGADARSHGAPFVNQIVVGVNGGPASANCDGWLTYMLPVTGGLILRDSIELDEQKYPISFESLELIPDSGGAGQFRGGPSARVSYGPRFGPMSVAVMADSAKNPAKGAAGGLPGRASSVALLDNATGEQTPLPGFGQFQVEPGTNLIGTDAGGGGFGDPARRDPGAVLEDVLEGLVSREQATEVYRVAFLDVPGAEIEVDEAATARLRTSG